MQLALTHTSSLRDSPTISIDTWRGLDVNLNIQRSTILTQNWNISDHDIQTCDVWIICFVDNFINQGSDLILLYL